ncbi:MAG: hypothetical protein K6E96_03790 [Bacteroidales bacterium]|nr:hypothetical protein [Bacteroidales bacterium]
MEGGVPALIPRLARGKRRTEGAVIPQEANRHVVKKASLHPRLAGGKRHNGSLWAPMARCDGRLAGGKRRTGGAVTPQEAKRHVVKKAPPRPRLAGGKRPSVRPTTLRSVAWCYNALRRGSYLWYGRLDVDCR